MEAKKVTSVENDSSENVAAHKINQESESQ